MNDILKNGPDNHMYTCVKNSDCNVEGNQCCMGYWDAIDSSTRIRTWNNQLACVTEDDLDGVACVNDNVVSFVKVLIIIVIVVVVLVCIGIAFCILGGKQLFRRRGDQTVTVIPTAQQN